METIVIQKRNNVTETWTYGRKPSVAKRCGSLSTSGRGTVRWGRVVVFASFMTLLLSTGVLGTLGMFVPIFLREFSFGSGELGWVASSGVSVESFAGPIGSFVVKRIGCRRSIMLGGILMGCGTVSASFATTVLHLFFCLGLVAGLGASMIHVATVVVIGKYYSRHYTVANGMAYSGPGAGVFVFPPLVQYLNDTYGWRGSLVIEAAILSNVLVLGALVRPASRFKSNVLHRKSLAVRGGVVGRKFTSFTGGGESKESCSSDGYSDDTRSTAEECSETQPRDYLKGSVNYQDDLSIKSAPSLWRRFRFSVSHTHPPAVLAVYSVCFFHTAGYSSVSVHLVNQAISSGVTDWQASLLLSCLGIGSFMGRVAHSWFLTWKPITPSRLFTLALVVCALTAALIPQNTTVGGMMASATTVGLCCGICFSLVAVILRDLVGITYLSSAFGFSLFCSGIGSTMGGYVTGALRDATGSYDVPFYLISGFFAIAALSSLLQSFVYWHQEYRHRHLPGPGATPI
ncbi:monocarboxylate transporter 12-like [Asterias rubens]|uniref:monocarboxylate transporter 12-like n=1 Tax=Asterias rubens TaxID=7604 RepID=UPI001454FA9F|nr:monocarboxylate transporter 12-like [Asterias rubens]XP_033644152.1 monocarboxylate transporter 12-like [Asterias rubens]XP_033644153.1 monocarboxylate transporter 12-like [Asterias rubens]XP_033644154.1 monocarboxylate transporter 12-like [Asterias rubens]XP_033644155.1 monocarboxylate transporter 12-like [Asterias rubens]